MTTDFEGQVSTWMKNLPISDERLSGLRGLTLPARRSRTWWLPRAIAAVGAAAVLVVVVVGGVSRFAPTGPAAGATPPDPAAFRGDPRLARCVGGGPDPLAAFEMVHASDYRLHLPNMGLSPELDLPDPAFVVVLAPGGTPAGVGGGGGLHPSDSPSNESTDPNAHDVCVLVGADASTADRTNYVDVDTRGLKATLAAGPSAPAGVLYLENRGGPAYVVTINGGSSTTIACDAAATLSPEKDGLPKLPWALSVTRLRDGAVLYSGEVAELPQWYLQIGETVLGLNATAVAGPAGPTCPPSG